MSTLDTHAIDTYTINPEHIEEKQTMLSEVKQPKKSWWATIKESASAGCKIADGSMMVGLRGAAAPDNKIARGMMAAGQVTQMVGAGAAIASGVPGWVAMLLIGGNSSILGGFFLGLRGGVSSLKQQAAMAAKQAEEAKTAWEKMTQEKKDEETAKMREQLKAIPPEMVGMYKQQIKSMYGVEL